MTETLERPEGITKASPLYLEVVGLEATDVGDQWEVSGIAIPYGEELERLDWITGARRWVFEEGSAKFRENTFLAYGHDLTQGGMPIGKLTLSEEHPTGPKVSARISKTAKGTEVYTLVKDGVLDRFSVGFFRVTEELSEADTDSPLLTFKEIDVFEVSIVPIPAFDSAVIESVLSSTTPPVPNKKEVAMTETLEAPDFAGLSASLDAVTASMDTLERRVATLGSIETPDAGPVVPGRSYGEFLKMLAAGETEALEFLAYVSDHPEALAYTGGVIANQGGWVKDSWIGDIYRPIVESRRLHNLFDSLPLPKDGMNVEYGRLLSDTLAVAEQAAEGDTLAYGKLTFDTATAPVKTYGGWTDMSRQQIERSGIAVVEQRFKALVNRYAQTTEAALRTLVANAANSTPVVGSGVTDFTTADGWIDFLVDASFMLEDKGLDLEFLIVGRDRFKSLAKLRDGANADAGRFLDRNNGTISITGLSGNVFNVPVIPVNSAGLVRAGHSSAIVTLEDGRAPFRLQDGDITNLTEAFSLYGYEAMAVQDKGALISADVTA